MANAAIAPALAVESLSIFTSLFLLFFIFSALGIESPF